MKAERFMSPRNQLTDRTRTATPRMWTYHIKQICPDNGGLFPRCSERLLEVHLLIAVRACVLLADNHPAPNAELVVAMPAVERNYPLFIRLFAVRLCLSRQFQKRRKLVT